MPPRAATTDFGRRVRAALVLRDRTIADVAPELNVSARTLERVLQGRRQARDWEIARLAELLEVPETFLRSGFDPEELLSSDQRLDRIEGLLTGIAADVAEVKRRQEGGL